MNHQINIVRSIKEIAPHQWALAHDELPTSMNYDYLSMIEEEHRSEVDFFYAMIVRNTATIGILCFQLINFKGAYVKNFFRQEVDRGWLKSFFLKLFYGILDFVNWKLLTTGNIFFTGDKGIYFDSSVAQEERKQLIKKSFDQVHQYCQKRVTAYMVNNVYDDKDEVIHEYLKEENYAAYPVDPDMFMEIDPDWTNFDDYTKDLSSKYRVRLRKVLKESAAIEAKKLSEQEVAIYHKELFQLYMNTAQKVNLNLGYLCENYFKNMADLWSNNFFVVAYFFKDKLVGFISVLKDNESLDANYMGLDYQVNLDFKLYNRILLDLVKLSIQLKATTLHLGRTATEIKSTIGATSHAMHIYLKGTNSILNKGMQFFEPYFGSPQYTLRHPFKN